MITTAHWEGDPRLNRHIDYLRKQSIPAELVSFISETRLRRLTNVLRAGRLIWTRRPRVVILPDPELFILGSIVARLRSSRCAIDIHEDYAKAVAGRSWIPPLLKPLVRLLATTNDLLARKLAGIVLVAAPELSSRGSILVANIPDPTGLTVSEPDFDSPTVVYVGDVTVARGATEMAQLARDAPDIRFLIIGKVDDALAMAMREKAGPRANLDLAGRQPHARAWELARGSIAGISLLRPLPAYLDAVATKLWEYCASGIPPIVTDLPGQASFVNGIDPILSVSGVAEARHLIDRMMQDQEWARSLSQSSRQVVVGAWERERPDLALYRAVAP